MGQGDKKAPFTPKYEPVRCDVSGKRFSPGMVRSCPEPHVIARYGVGGVANVCWYVCNRCKYAEHMKNYGGIKCGYVRQLQG